MHFAHLLRHLPQSAFPGIKKLLTLTGETNKNSVVTAVNILRSFGIVVVQRFGRSNVYIFQDSYYWKPVDKEAPRIRISHWADKYQKRSETGIKSTDSVPEIDTLTNLNKNSPKDITHLMRSLSDRMNINTKKPENRQPLAIPEGSTHSVVRSAYEQESPTEIPPWRRHMPSEVEKEAPVANATRMQREGVNQPDNTGEIQAENSIKFDTSESVKTGKLREGIGNKIDTDEPFINGEKRGEDPFKNGEKWVEEANDLSPGNIRNEDLSAGSAE